MRQRLLIIIGIAAVLAILIALNAASYVEIERRADSELYPDRSTYNSSPTGTRAFHDFLIESGYKAMRWRERPMTLLGSNRVQPQTFVIIGETRVQFSDEDKDSLLRWVAAGGRLVLIDRVPHQELIPAIGNWRLYTVVSEYPPFNLPSTQTETITAGIGPANPVQPTLLTKDVGSVRHSKFTARIIVPPLDSSTIPDPESTEEDEDADASEEEADEGADFEDSLESSPAPVVHVSDEKGAILIDYAYGAGRIVILGDPFIVANNGIDKADNLQLAVNIVSTPEGVIAFDEYHHGRAASHNRFFAYFAGTPVMPMLGQFLLIVMAVLWSRGRRFAKPLPLPGVDRRSKLEFIASMAEVQQRARAHDLALENIYQRTRRVLSKYAGVSHNAQPSEIAARVSERSTVNRTDLERYMIECESAIAGEKISARKALDLASKLREFEHSLGLTLRSRERRQARGL